MALTVHIAGIKDTEANIKTGLDDSQSALNTTGLEHVHMIGTDIYYSLAGRKWDGAALTYLDVEVDDLTARNDVIIDRYVSHRSDSDTRIYFHTDTDRIQIIAGGVTFVDMIETTQDILKINPDSADLDFQVSGIGFTSALFVQGSNGFVGVGTGAPSVLFEVALATSANNVYLTTSDQAVGNPKMVLWNKTSGTGAGLIQFSGANSVGGGVAYGYIQGKIITATQNVESGQIQVYTTINGTTDKLIASFGVGNNNNVCCVIGGTGVSTNTTMFQVVQTGSGNPSIAQFANVTATNAYIRVEDATTFTYVGAKSSYAYIGQVNDLSSSNIIIGGSGGGIGITAASAKWHIVSTTEQLRLGYSTTVDFSVTIDSDGDTTFKMNDGDLMWFESSGLSESGGDFNFYMPGNANPSLGLYAYDSGNARQEYARIMAGRVDTTAGSEDGDLQFLLTIGGSVEMERFRIADTDITTTSAHQKIATLGKTLKIKEGSGGMMGTAVLVAGTVTVTNSNVLTGDRILVTRVSTGGTVGAALTYTISNGTSFTITSDNPLDTSTVLYFILRGA